MMSVSKTDVHFRDCLEIPRGERKQALRSTDLGSHKVKLKLLVHLSFTNESEA